MISLLEIKKNALNKYRIDLEYQKSDLRKTSSFAENSNAIAAVNGGFFNRDKGGSVTYMEKNDSVLFTTPEYGPKWRVSDNLMTGAVIIGKNGELIIDSVQPDSFYINSPDEYAVLVSGPLLIRENDDVLLPEKEFVSKRHPRTCLCETGDSYFFMAIDGRSSRAEGMNLYEVRELMHSLKCRNGINLDGGGSTTMWISGRGVVNNPSDITGERVVANVLMVKMK